MESFPLGVSGQSSADRSISTGSWADPSTCDSPDAMRCRVSMPWRRPSAPGNPNGTLWGIGSSKGDREECAQDGNDFSSKLPPGHHMFRMGLANPLERPAPGLDAKWVLGNRMDIFYNTISDAAGRSMPLSVLRPIPFWIAADRPCGGFPCERR